MVLVIICIIIGIIIIFSVLTFIISVHLSQVIGPTNNVRYETGSGRHFILGLG